MVSYETIDDVVVELREYAVEHLSSPWVTRISSTAEGEEYAIAFVHNRSDKSENAEIVVDDETPRIDTGDVPQAEAVAVRYDSSGDEVYLDYLLFGARSAQYPREDVLEREVIGMIDAPRELPDSG